MRISIVIPTVGRYESLTRLLGSFLIQTHHVDEIVIVDQSAQAWADLPIWVQRLPIVYVRSDVRSLPHARNVGVEKSSGDMVGFLDDDIVLSSSYIEKLQMFFDAHPQALGVQGVIENFIDGHIQKVGGVFWYTLYAQLSRFFCLNTAGKENKILLSGRNVYAVSPQTVIVSEWLSGIGNYRRSVFVDHRFDECMTGYALGEDKMFSYGIFVIHPNALFTDPSIRCEHHHADGGRPTGQRQVQMKIYYTYYFWYAYFHHIPLAHVAFWWANMWDMVLVLCSVVLRRSSCLVWCWHLYYYAQVLFFPTRVRSSLCK